MPITDGDVKWAVVQVDEAAERLKAAGLADLVEDEATCCYARQDKVWAIEPQGLRWEWYRVLEDSETFGEDTAPKVRAEDLPEERVGGCC